MKDFIAFDRWLQEVKAGDLVALAFVAYGIGDGSAPLAEHEQSYVSGKLPLVKAGFRFLWTALDESNQLNFKWRLNEWMKLHETANRIPAQ